MEETNRQQSFPPPDDLKLFFRISRRKAAEALTKQEKLLTQNIDPSMRDQAVTVCKIEKAMRSKVKALIPLYKESDPTQTVTSTQGEKVLKSNPAMQEIRATFRDYCTIVKVQQDILANRAAPVEVANINSIRQKLKIAK